MMMINVTNLIVLLQLTPNCTFDHDNLRGASVGNHATRVVSTDVSNHSWCKKGSDTLNRIQERKIMLNKSADQMRGLMPMGHCERTYRWLGGKGPFLKRNFIERH
jgi:hypothetical protein